MSTRLKAKSYSEQINNALVMSGGLKNNLEHLATRGMSRQFIHDLDVMRNRITKKDGEQEKLKAELKLATAELNEMLKDLNSLMKEAIKVVKLGMPQEQWKEFSIQDKR